MSSSVVPQDIEKVDYEIKGLFPGLYWNNDRDEEMWNRIEEIKSEVDNCDAIGVVDTDADGLACEVVLREKFDNPIVIGAGSNKHGISYTHAMNLISEIDTTGIPVIVADLSPDDNFSSYLASVAKVDSPVYVYDHHDWDWTAKTSISSVVDELVINEDRCASQILQNNQYPEADDNLLEFLEVTADHDLWIKEDPRSDHLSTLSFCLSRNDYVNKAREHWADMVEESKELEILYEESEKESDKMAKIAVDKAVWFEGVQGATVAITYFNCHQSRVGDTLIENGADIAVVIQPTLGVSFRSNEEYNICAELANGLGGGGHKKAAGAGIYDMIDKNKSVDSLHFEELNEKPEEIDVESLDRFEYTWRTEGKQIIHKLKNYIEAEMRELNDASSSH